MNLRARVEGWHGGQLVIAWVVGVIVTTAIAVASLPVADFINRREAVQLAVFDSVAGGRRYDPENPFAELAKRLTPAEARTRHAIEDQRRRSVNFLFAFSLLVVPALALVTALWATWTWFGARSPGRSTPRDTE